MCGWGRVAWQPQGLVVIRSCSSSLMSLFRIPSVLLTGLGGRGRHGSERGQGQPPSFKGRTEKGEESGRSLFVKGYSWAWVPSVA